MECLYSLSFFEKQTSVTRPMHRNELGSRIFSKSLSSGTENLRKLSLDFKCFLAYYDFTLLP